MFSDAKKRVKKIGQPPGTPIYTGEEKQTTSTLTAITYNTNDSQEFTGTRLEDCLGSQKIEGITWLNINGLNNIELVNQVAKKFDLHPLTVEDILNVEQRSKVEEFENYIFVTLKVLLPSNSIKQLSLVLGKDFVLSFQETNTSLFDTVRDRLKNIPNQRLRQQGGDYLLYRLIDIVIDQYFSVLETLGDQLEQTEERIITDPTPQNSRSIYQLKRQILLLRKAIWPVREAISHLMHTESDLITKFTSVYLRDVYDHTIQAIDTLETFRDMLSGMLDMYLSSITNYMNEIMKTLTIITTIFVPITAIASIYGMNFAHMPGLQWQWGYETALSLMVLIAVLMLLYFKKKKWI